MKIIFIGAGIASLVAAERLGRAGFEVVVYEKNTYDTLSYDWHDDVNQYVFSTCDLPMPKQGTYFQKKNWTFISPSENVEVTLDLPKEKLDLSIERRMLAQQYVDRAKDVVNFRFGVHVSKLFIERGVVKGIIADDKKVFADLVVDNSGTLSNFRGQLPKDCGISAQPQKDEVFYAYRAFHKKTAEINKPSSSNRVYLKHLGECGISWCIIDPSDTVNILIGRVGELSNRVFDNAYFHLKKSNPIIGDEVERGGGIYVIPVRYPLLKMMTEGYCAIGDAAFMTIPMLGSGIENSIHAAFILADVIIRSKSVSQEVLWQYEVEYFKSRGAKHMGVDVLKRWLLNADPNDLDYLFENGIIDNSDMAAGATGNIVKLTPKALVCKAIRGWRHPELLLHLAVVLSKTKKAERIGNAIPKKFDKEAIAVWKKKVEALFN